MSEEKINGGQLLTMFLQIQSAELKNVRTLERDNKEMVSLLTRYIEKRSNESHNNGDDEE